MKRLALAVFLLTGNAWGQETVTPGTVNQGTGSTAASAFWTARLSDGAAYIAIATDRTTAGGPFSVRLSDGAAFYNAPTSGQLPAALVGGRLDMNLGAWFGATTPTVGQKAMTASLPVVISSDQSAVTVAGSGTFTVGDGAGALNVIVDSSALPTGAATAANQDGIVRDGAGDTTQANVSSGRLHVDGSGVTQPISAAALPLPAGAATSALQDGIVKDGAGDTTQANVSTGRLHVDGSGVTQPVSGTVTANAGSGTFVIGDGAGALNVIVDSSALPTGASTLAEQQTQTTSLQKIDNVAHAGSDVALSEHVPVSAQLDDAATTTVTENQIAPLRLTSARALHVAQQGNVTVTDGAGAMNVIVDSSALPAGAATSAEQATQTASLSVLDDWDETDRAKVNPIVGQAGVQGGAGAVTALTQRVALATDANSAKVTDGTDTALVSGSGSLQVTCDNCGGASPFEDNDAFTPTTSSVVVIGAEVDDTATTAITENSAGAPRMSTRREIYQQIRDAAGNERGANVSAGNALLVDASATTQPVSAASLPLPTGAATSALQDGIVKDGTGDTTQANVSSGRLHVDGSGVTQPVSGTVTVTDGLDVDTVAADQITPLGTAADGAAVSGNPLRIGGKDGSGNTQDIITDAAGELQVDVLTLPSVTIGTFPDNEPFNLAQVAGATAQSGSGTSTGALRVELPTNGTGTLATVSTVTTVTTVTNLTNLPNEGQQTAGNSISVTPDTDNDAIGATGAAPPGEVVDMGGRTSGADTTGLMSGITVCDSHAAVDIVTATTTLIVTGVANRHVRICAINLVTAAANNVALIAGTGATCGTSTAGINGGTTAAEGWNLAANGGLAQGSGLGEIMSTKVAGGATGDSVCIITSAGTQLSGTVSYAIY